MAKYLKEWLDYIESMVGRGVYVWGAQGETVASIGGASKVKAWITARYASQPGSASTRAANAAKAYKYYQELAAKIGSENIFFFDCSGFGMYFFQNLKKLSGDTTAAGMYNACTKINKADRKAGDMVFKKNSSGKINHIGYVARDTNMIIEARASGYGVVKRKLSATTWTLFGRIKWLKAEIESGTGGISLTETGVSLNRPTLKVPSVGPDVKTAQNLLLAKGYKLPKYGADGDYGSETKAAVVAFQRDNGLIPDGIIGPLTWAALLEVKAVTGQVVEVYAGNYHVRPEPRSTKSFGVAKKGSKWPYLGVTSPEGWHKIDFNGTEGYISGVGSRVV